MSSTALLGAIALTLMVAACTSEPAAPDSSSPTTTTAAPAGFGFDEVVQALTAAGATVAERGADPGFPFSVARQRLTAAGHELAVYEYADEAHRADEQAGIGMEGWSVGGAPVEWIGAPHFWPRGRVIVMYLGDDAGALDLLTRAFGPELDLSPIDPDPACRDHVDEYPPPTITVAVGGTRYEVRFLWWQCYGYNADNFVGPFPVTGRPGDRVEVRLAVEEGSTILVTAGTRLPTDPLDGSGWSFALPDGGREVMIRICAADRRCAGYWIVVEAAP